MRSRAVSEGASAEVRSSSEREESIVSPSFDHISLCFFSFNLSLGWYVAEKRVMVLAGAEEI